MSLQHHRTGHGKFLYQLDTAWGEIPDHIMTYDIAGIGIDTREQVYLFNRGEHPIVVLDKAGKFVKSWGDNVMYPRAHAITMGADDTIWLTDSGDHTVRKCSLDGEVLMTLGVSGYCAPAMSGQPFNQCTHVAIHPHTAEIFVSDGYGNPCVHKFSPDGKHLFSWGEPGNQPGQFNLPHNICADKNGLIYVADRHNARVQVFTDKGEYLDSWTGMALPCGMYIGTHHKQELCYLAELSSAMWAQKGTPYECWDRPGMGPRVSIYDLQGNRLAKLLDEGSGEKPGQMIAPHCITVDSQGTIYVGELSYLVHGSQCTPPRQVRNLQVLKKLPEETADHTH